MSQGIIRHVTIHHRWPSTQRAGLHLAPTSTLLMCSQSHPPSYCTSACGSNVYTCMYEIKVLLMEFSHLAVTLFTSVMCKVRRAFRTFLSIEFSHSCAWPLLQDLSSVLKWKLLYSFICLITLWRLTLMLSHALLPCGNLYPYAKLLSLRQWEKFPLACTPQKKVLSLLAQFTLHMHQKCNSLLKQQLFIMCGFHKGTIWPKDAILPPSHDWSALLVLPLSHTRYF